MIDAGRGVIIKSVFSIISILVCASGFAADDLEDLEIIDWHVHVAGLGYKGSGCYVNDEMRENYRFGIFLKWMNVSQPELERYGDRIVVERLNEKIGQSKYIDAAVVLALDGVVDAATGQLDRENTQVYVPNDYLAAEAAKYPRLLFGASINPNRPDAIERLERVARQGAVLVKWIPSIMYIDPADERFIPFYEKMAELDIPLLTHTGQERSFPNARDELADPLRLKLPLSLGVTVIAAHIATTGESGGQDNFERILPMFNQYLNLFTGISSLTQINKLGYLVDALKIPGLTEKMIYGSDWPLQYFPVVSPWYHINHIGLGNVRRIRAIENEWDRDVMLKRALGVPNSVFMNRPPGRPFDLPAR